MDSILINYLGEMAPILNNNHNNNNIIINNNQNINYNRNSTSNNWKVSITSMNGSQLPLEDEEDILSINLTTSSIVWIIVYIHGIIN